MALATYFERFRFKHPTPDDFFRTLNEEIGQDLTWFFEEAYATANVYDYAAERLDTLPVRSRGYDDGSPATFPAFEEKSDETQFRTTVVVRRIGEGHFPVDVLVTFDNGEELREKWDGQARWQSFVYVRPSKAVSVQVDPDRVLLLDVNYTNNSITLQPKAAEAADRWALTWMVWLQDLLLNYAFFV
jgi:hypothetical protein